MAVGACFYAHPLYRQGAGVFSVRNVPESGETQGPRGGGMAGGGDTSGFLTSYRFSQI